MSKRVERARKVNSVLRAQKKSIQKILPQLTKQSIVMVSGDAAKGREVASAITESADLMEVRNWEVNIVTKPGDVVYDPKKEFKYIFTGASKMTHANPTFFPGASGVYYWAIIPRMKDGFKIYPSINGIIVAVKQHEVWWDTAAKKLYEYIQGDNPTCSHPPGSAATIWREYNM